MYVRGKIGDRRGAGWGISAKDCWSRPGIALVPMLDIFASFAILRGSKLFTAKHAKNSQRSRRKACSKLVTKQSSGDS
jgi:hypothetical protein